MALSLLKQSTAGGAYDTAVFPDGVTDLSLKNIGATGTLALRCAAGEQNAETITAHAPTDCEVKIGDGEYGATATAAAGTVRDSDVIVTYKRTVATVTNQRVDITFTPHIADITVEDIPEAPAAFTPTVSSITATGCAVAFSTTDPDPGATLTYKVAVTTSATPPADWTGYADQTSPYAATGLTPLTTYYAHVRAFDGTFATVGTSASFDTAEAPPAHTDDFTGTAGAAPNTALWTVATAGGGAVVLDGSGYCGVATSTGTDAAILARKTAVTRTSVKEYAFNLKVTSAGEGASRLLALCNGTSVAATIGSVPNISVLYNAAPAQTGVPSFALVYVNSSAAAQYWNGTAWTTTPYYFVMTLGQAYVVRLATTTTQWRLTVDGVTQTTLINWSGTATWGASAWLVTGDLSNTAGVLAMKLDYYDEV